MDAPRPRVVPRRGRVRAHDPGLAPADRHRKSFVGRKSAWQDGGTRRHEGVRDEPRAGRGGCVIELTQRQLRGSYTPLVTPFEQHEIDFAAFERSIERQAKEGSHGIVVTGTSGEPTSLSSCERAELYRVAVAAADGRLPVVAATGSPNQRETFELTEAAQAAGVDAVLVVAPAFVKPSQDGLAR